MENISIKTITLKNFGIFKDQVIDCHNKDIIGILAEYRSDKTRSNRSGKCFGKNTRIIMFDGSVKAVQNIVEGEKIMGPDSKPRKVSGVTSGKDNMYVVKSNNGFMKFKCNSGHILSLKSSCDIIVNDISYSKTDTINIAVKDYLKLTPYKKSMLHLYRSNEIEYKETKQEIPPYLFGLWLGDGSNYGPQITNGEPEIYEYLTDYCEAVGINMKIKEYEGKTKVYWDFKLTGKQAGLQGSTNEFVNFLSSMDLKHKKRILKNYMICSVRQRLELLAGLLDTDGYLSKNGNYEIIVKRKELAGNIVQLCRSLGLAVNYKVKYSNIGETQYGPYFRITIWGDIYKIPCLVERKRTDFKTTKRDVLRKGFTVHAIGAGAYYGFAVDKDNLFLLSDYTVVHNSLIPESIKYNLIGVTRAKRNISMIHHGEDHMFVEVVYISTDGTEYVIKRGVDHKSNSVLELDWIEKVSDSQEAIGELFGIHKSDFESTSFFNQSDINGFMDLPPAEKSRYLMESMNLTHWADKHKLVMADIKNYSAKLSENEAVKKALEASLEDTDDLNMVESDIVDKVDKLNTKMEKTDKEISELSAARNEILNHKKVLLIKRGELVKKVRKSELAEQELETWQKQSERIKLANTKNREKLIKLPTLSDISVTLAKDKAERKTLMKRLDIAKNNKGVCPLLDTPCSEITFSVDVIDELRKEIVKIENNIKHSYDVIKKQDEQEEIKSEIDNNKLKLGRLNDKIANYESNSTLTKDKADLETVITTLKAGDGVEDLELKIYDLINSIKPDLRSDIKAYEQKLGGIKQRLIQAKDALSRINKVAENNKKLKIILSDLKFIATMFSKNGIALNEIENVFSTIEDECNMILKELDYGPTIVFSPDKELTKWEPICNCGFKFPKGYRSSECEECGDIRYKQRKEEVSLRILEDGIEKDFSMDSGGGKLIIAFVVRIALTMYKRRQNKCKLNVLFLDEIDSALDTHLASAVTNAITRLLTKKLGFDQIFMISHKDEIKYSVPHILKVVRFDTYSRAKFI